MKKFLLLAFATLLISPSVGETAIKSSNNNNLNGNNNDSIVSEQSEDTYTIRFLNDEGSVLSSEQYEFGAMPEAPDTPSKEHPLDEYTYTFSGWSPSIALVTADADYVATYKAEAKTGEVIWVDGDGETLLTENYPYGSMPNYHGTMPTKTPTDTETYVFKGWSPEIILVESNSITYTAQFNSVPISTEYSIQINCTDCLVNKKKSINEKHASLSDLTYQFNKTSKETYHYPYALDVKVDGVSTNDYVYDNYTGRLNIKLIGNTVINAIADNSCVLMKYEYSADSPTVEILCDGDFESVDWGDGTTYDATSKSHTYSPDSNAEQYNIRIFGKLSSIGTTSKAVTSVDIFQSVTSIGANAFKDCISLARITIPDSVVSIYAKVFSGCPSLTIYCESESKPTGWSSSWNDDNRPVYWGYLSSRSIDDFNYVVQQIGGIKQIIISKYIGDSSIVNVPSEINVDGENLPVISIGNSAFYNRTSLVSVTIASNVISIESCAFYNCTSLVSITVPNSGTSTTSIGNHAFYNCTSLTNVTVPNGTTSIDNYAFYGCSSLVSLVIPDTVTSVGEYAFSNCSKLASFEMTNRNGTTVINHYAFSNCSKLASFEVPNSVAAISNGAFSDCRSLVSVTVPHGINLIGSNAFYNCSSLTDITVLDSTKLTSIDSYAFYNCSSLTSITIPDSVRKIREYAFSGCSSLASIIIPSSVTSMGTHVFEDCSSIVIYCKVEAKPVGWDSSWNSSGRSVYWGYIASGSTNDFNYIAQQIDGIKKAVISKYIGTDTIANIPSDINVDGDEIQVTSLGPSTFGYCSSLTSVVIPNTITSIGKQAFDNCTSLTSIVIPNSVTLIDAYAFNECSSLELLDMSNCDHVVSAGYLFLYFTKNTLVIKVKASLVEQYKSAPWWSDHAGQIIGV